MDFETRAWPMTTEHTFNSNQRTVSRESIDEIFRCLWGIRTAFKAIFNMMLLDSGIPNFTKVLVTDWTTEEDQIIRKTRTKYQRTPLNHLVEN